MSSFTFLSRFFLEILMYDYKSFCTFFVLNRDQKYLNLKIKINLIEKNELSNYSSFFLNVSTLIHSTSNILEMIS